MAHDFIKFPELTNQQMQFYYFESPHKQITEDIRVKVIRVKDGDTIEVEWFERDFNFPIRFLEIDAPELDGPRGESVKSWLKERIEGEEVDILIDQNNRVGVWGRLLGHIFHRGMDVGEEMMNLGLVTSFEARHEGKIPDATKILEVKLNAT